MKKQYMKPSMKVYELQSKTQLLAGSGYGGPLGARRFDGWDDDWDEE